MSDFSFSHSVFKRLVLQTHKNQGLFGKGLILSQTSPGFYMSTVQVFWNLISHACETRKFVMATLHWKQGLLCDTGVYHRQGSSPIYLYSAVWNHEFIAPFPKLNILYSSKLKEFADDNFEFDWNGRKFSKRVESILSFSRNVFYTSQNIFQFLRHIYFCHLLMLSIWISQKICRMVKN